MRVITVKRWREKLFVFLVAVLIIGGLSWGLSKFVGFDSTTATTPTESLQDDVLLQPVKVQGEQLHD